METVQSIVSFSNRILHSQYSPTICSLYYLIREDMRFRSQQNHCFLIILLILSFQKHSDPQDLYAPPKKKSDFLWDEVRFVSQQKRQNQALGKLEVLGKPAPRKIQGGWQGMVC